jgi:hypothetical protein
MEGGRGGGMKKEKEAKRDKTIKRTKQKRDMSIVETRRVFAHV